MTLGSTLTHARRTFSRAIVAAFGNKQEDTTPKHSKNDLKVATALYIDGKYRTAWGTHLYQHVAQGGFTQDTTIAGIVQSLEEYTCRQSEIEVDAAMLSHEMRGFSEKAEEFLRNNPPGSPAYETHLSWFNQFVPQPALETLEASAE